MASRQRDPGSRNTGSRPAVKAARDLPWDAEADAHHLLAGLALLPRAPAADSRRRRPTPLPPPVPNLDDEPSFTPSLRAPRDLPMPEPEPRKPAPKKSVGIADFLRDAFAQRLYGSVRYRLTIGAPTASTASGKKKTREPILLVPSNESGPEILCGWLDNSRKEAQVRSYGVMALLHENRYCDEPGITEDEYERFLDKLMDTLFEGGIRLVLLVPDVEDFESTQVNPVPVQKFLPPVPSQTAAVQRSRLPGREVKILAGLAFALGLSAGPVFSGISYAIYWLTHVSSWLHQAAIAIH